MRPKINLPKHKVNTIVISLVCYLMFIKEYVISMMCVFQVVFLHYKLFNQRKKVLMFTNSLDETKLSNKWYFVD